jgi:inosine-uridine nucleoside N-ribohydrolase
MLCALVGASCQPASPTASEAAVAPSAGSVVGATVEPTAGSSRSLEPSSLPLPTAAPVRLLVDTDGAPDDLVAISFLVASPNVEIAAITIAGTGEVHCPRGVDVVLSLLERLDAPPIPVACGVERPTALDHAFPDLFRSNADAAAGLDLPPTDRTPSGTDAVDLITSTALARDGDLRIVTLGPLTNLAQALAGTDLSERIEAVYSMGGAVDVPGNIAGSPGGPQDNTTAEWNVYVDPAALASVLDADLDVRLVSLDGTDNVPLTTAFADHVLDVATAPPLEVLAELLRKNDYMRSGSYYLWDAIAAVAAAGFPVAEFTDGNLIVDVSEGVTSGATRRQDGQANAAYMTRADAAAIERLLISVMNAT